MRDATAEGLLLEQRKQQLVGVPEFSLQGLCILWQAAAVFKDTRHHDAYEAAYCEAY